MLNIAMEDQIKNTNSDLITTMKTQYNIKDMWMIMGVYFTICNVTTKYIYQCIQGVMFMKLTIMRFHSSFLSKDLMLSYKQW